MIQINIINLTLKYGEITNDVFCLGVYERGRGREREE